MADVLRSTRLRHLCCLVAAVLLLDLVVGTSRAGAHTPHDHIIDVAVSPDFEQSRTVYAISRTYLLRSTDGGDSWTRVVRGLDHRRAPSSVSVAPGDPRVVYLTTRGDGVFRSVDSGETWAEVNGALGQKNLHLAEVSPHDPDLVVVAGPGAFGTAWMTADGGGHWTEVPGIAQPTAVAFAPDDPAAVVIGDESGNIHWSDDRGTSWSTTNVGLGPAGAIRAVTVTSSRSTGRTFHVGTAEAGVLTTSDLGTSFAPASLGLDEDAIVDLHVTGTYGTEPTLWASTVHEGIFRSDDHGSTWRHSGRGLTTDEMADRIGASNFGTIDSAPTVDRDPTMFVATFDGLFRSTDGAGSWEYLDTQVPSHIVSVAVSPDHRADATLAIATYINGALLSEDGGASWTPINEGLATRFEWMRRDDYVARLTGIAFHPTFATDRKMFAGLRGYYLESTDAGRHWNAYLPEGILVEDEFPADYYVPAFSPDFEDDRTILLATDGGKVFRHTGDPTSIEMIGSTGIEVTALVLSSAGDGGQVAIAGTPEGLLRSTDGGRSWSPSGDVGRPVTSLTMSDDFGEDGTAFAGTPSGLFVTTNGAGAWRRIQEDLFGPKAVVEAVVASPEFSTDGTLLVSIRGRGLFRSTDGGSTFEPVAEELLADQAVLGSFYHPTTEPIVFSPTFAEDQTVYGIAEDRLYRSTDAGLSWTKVEFPVTHHDPDTLPESPLLESARYDPDLGASGGADSVRTAAKPRPDGAFHTPIGLLSARRVGAAALLGIVVFGLLSLAGPLVRGAAATAAPTGSALLRPVILRIGLALASVAAALLLLAT